MDTKGRAVIADLSAGRNSADPPLSPRLAVNQCVDAVNVDFYRSTFANKRNGISASSVAFSSGGPFTGKISSLARHVPGTDESAAEEWAVDDAATPVVGRKAGATTFTAPTLKDAPTGNGWDFSFASLNGKHFVAYKSAQGRLHCWDTSTVRRTGLPAPDASVGGIPTADNAGGAGTYAPINRYYRIRWTEQVGGILVRRSEPGMTDLIPGRFWTPDGVHLNFTVTRQTPPGEGETHWELEASLDAVTFYRIATIAIATATYADATPVTSYNTGTNLSPLTGTYTLQKAYKFIAADENRLLGFGSYTSTDKQNRIEISAVLGSRDIGDAERVDTTTNWYVDLDEHDSGAPTGLRGPVFGNFYAFKSRQFWELTPTGVPTSPYRRTALSKTIGAVGGMAHCIGEDAAGNAALYWMSHRGIYRYGVGGMEYLGKGIEDYVLGPTATINLAATKVICHMLYHPEKRQVWVWWATGSSNDPNQCAFYDVTTGGWTRVPTGDKLANLRCSMLFSHTIAASMSRDLKPYGGSALTANVLYQCDDPAAMDDAGTPFQGFVITRPLEPGGPGVAGEVGDAFLTAKAAEGVTITATVIPDFDATLTKVGTASLTAVGAETRVSVRLHNSGLRNAGFVQYQIGDATAIAGAWTLDRLVIPFGKLGSLSA